MAELKKTEKARLIRIASSVSFSDKSLSSGKTLSKERKKYIRNVSSRALKAALSG
jgi:type IV secretory pathway ATPase VirB11/archaellum biosynthesis ATPase